MSNSFLSVLQRRGGNNGDGDQYGGAAGHDGRGLPTVLSRNFMFATGIECSYPTIRDSNGHIVRRDLLDECKHYELYKEDLALVQELGLKFVRYGLPYHKIHLGPDKFDWEWADMAMGELRRLELTPILDLCHFGVPDWIGDFQNPDFPYHFANYCDAVAERYPWVRYYTPVNEIFVAARISAKEGKWNECLKSDKAFITALKHLTAASIIGNHRIAARRPDCVIVQSESAEYIHQAVASESLEIQLSNELRFLSLDLLYAHPCSSLVSTYAFDNGLTRQEWDWFMRGEPPGYQVMGHDYYGRHCQAEDVLGWYGMARDYYFRYHKPIMHTETNVFDADFAPCWLWKQWMAVLRLRREGVPVLGFTWYSLIDQIDWDSQLIELNHRVNECGLFDIKRKPRKVAKDYRLMLEQFGQITLMPHGELFEMTEAPARLKVDV